MSASGYAAVAEVSRKMNQGTWERRGQVNKYVYQVRVSFLLESKSTLYSAHPSRRQGDYLRDGPRDSERVRRLAAGPSSRDSCASTQTLRHSQWISL